MAMPERRVSLGSRPRGRPSGSGGSEKCRSEFNRRVLKRVWESEAVSNFTSLSIFEGLLLVGIHLLLHQAGPATVFDLEFRSDVTQFEEGSHF